MENAKTIIFYMSKGERSNCNSYISTSHPIIVDLVFVQIILTRLQKLAMCIYLETQSGFRLETSMIGMIFFLRQPQEKRISSMASPKHSKDWLPTKTADLRWILPHEYEETDQFLWAIQKKQWRRLWLCPPPMLFMPCLYAFKTCFRHIYGINLLTHHIGRQSVHFLSP